MRKYIYTLICAALAFSACEQQRVTYSDKEYIMFPDSTAIRIVLEEQDWFTIPVVATTVCDYDRTFAVEVVDKGSNAIENFHYVLKSNTLTIPAGENTAYVEAHGIYDRFENAVKRSFILRLVIPEEKRGSIGSDTIRIDMYKSCPFSLDNFTGWCMVTSTFLKDFPGTENTSIQRLIRTEKHPVKENTVILHDWLFTGFDVTITLDNSDPAAPLVTMDKGQVLSEEIPVFGQMNGDNKILCSHSPYTVSSFNTCQNFVALWTLVYVENLGSPVGTVGEYYNILEWVSDEEADRLQREEGM